MAIKAYRPPREIPLAKCCKNMSTFMCYSSQFSQPREVPS
jgi:hypothetical protein